MRQSRVTAAHIVAILIEAVQEGTEGRGDLPDEGITEQTSYRWRRLVVLPTGAT